MRGGAAHIEVVDRRAIPCPAWRGSQEEQLLQRQLALKDVAFGQTPLTLEVERRDDLTVADDVPDVRRVFRQRVDDSVAERLALIVPRALLQLRTARTGRSTT